MGQSIRNIVASIVPAHNETVAPETPITIEFNEHMAGSSLTEDTIYILGNLGQQVPVDYNYSGMNKRLTLTPKKPFENGIYNLMILSGDTGPKTSFGLTSETPYSYYFRVKETSSEEDIEVLSEEVNSTETASLEKEDDFVDVEIDGIFLEDSYPTSGDVRNAGESVVLLFSKEVSSDELIDNVYISKKPIHPLLADVVKDERIILQPTKSVGKAHTFVLSEELVDGSEAELVLSKELMDGETIRIPFQQNWSQLYANPKDVRLVLGLFGNAFSDADLARLIYRESSNAYQVMLTRPSFVEEEWDNNFPHAAGQYVIYKTAYQAILGQVLESGSGMRQSMSLGDFQVAESESTSREIKDLIGLLKDEVDRWWKILNGVTEDEIDGIDTFTRLAGSATRGVTESSYPDFITRVPFQDLGG